MYQIIQKRHLPHTFKSDEAENTLFCQDKQTPYCSKRYPIGAEKKIKRKPYSAQRFWIWVINALQHCTCFALRLFWPDCHWSVLFKRRARLTYEIINRVPLITISVPQFLKFSVNSFRVMKNRFHETTITSDLSPSLYLHKHHNNCYIQIGSAHPSWDLVIILRFYGLL